MNIDQAAKQYKTYRTALWTGKHFQVTLMSINVQMGGRKDKLDFQAVAYDDYAIMIPAGKWHNIINTGITPLKIYVIYAPPEHPYGTVHETKAVAMSTEG